MKSIIIIASCFMLFVLKATSLATDSLQERNPRPGLPYPERPMTWTGSIAGGPKLNVEGTIEQVISVLQATQPKFDYAALQVAAKAKAENSSISTRTVTVWNCDPDNTQYAFWYGNFPWSLDVPIEDAIRHLKTVGGTCNCPPHSCVRVSCSWDQAVYLCNDRDWTMTPDCSWLGNPMVQLIADNCQDRIIAGTRNGEWPVVRGKIWDTELYSITYEYLPGTC